MRKRPEQFTPMGETMQLMGRAPMYVSGAPEMPRDEWFQLWETIVDAAHAETKELIEFIRKIPYPVLKGVQTRAFGDGSPYSNVGEIKIIPDDAHLKKSGNRTSTEERELKELGYGYPIRNLYLEIHLLRASDILYHQARTRTRLPHYMIVGLHIAPGPEMLALRHIQQNWRGIVELLLEDLPIEASIVQSNNLHNSAKIKGSLRIIDYVVQPSTEEEENYLELNFLWGPNLPSEDAIRCFQALSILFTCIQQGTHSPRSKKRHILDAWLKIAASRKVDTQTEH